MKIIIFQLLTGFTIGSLVSVTFDDKIFKVVDILGWRINRKGLYINVMLLNQYGGIEICNYTCLKDIFKDKRLYSEIEEVYRKFNLNEK